MIAESIAKALGGRKTGAGWMSHCYPANDTGKPTVSDDGGLRHDR